MSLFQKSWTRLRTVIPAFVFWSSQVISAPVDPEFEGQDHSLNPWSDSSLQRKTLAEQEEDHDNCVTLLPRQKHISQLRLAFPPGSWTSTGLYQVDDLLLQQSSVRAGQGDRKGSRMIRFKYRVGIHPDLDGPDLFRPASVMTGEKILLSANGDGTDYLDSGLVPKSNGGLSYISLIPPHESSEHTLCYSTTGLKVPWFKLGRDSAEKWQADIRNYPAPWAELQGERSILTLPSAMIRDLDDPTRLVKAYDIVVKRAENFIGLSPDSEDPRHRSPALPYRFVMDVNTNDADRSHAGDPIILNLLQSKEPTNFLIPEFVYLNRNITRLVALNLSPAHNRVLPPGAAGPMADVSGLLQIFKGRNGYMNFMLINEIPRHPPWHLVNIFSWEYIFRGLWNDDIHNHYQWRFGFFRELAFSTPDGTFTAFFKSYRDTPEEELPTNQQQGTDFFFIRICTLVRRDLNSLFRKWQVPVSEQAYSFIASMRMPGYAPRRTEL